MSFESNRGNFLIPIGRELQTYTEYQRFLFQTALQSYALPLLQSLNKLNPICEESSLNASNISLREAGNLIWAGISSQAFSGQQENTLNYLDRIKSGHLVSLNFETPGNIEVQLHHLLNIRHLESVHNQTLRGLKILKIDDVVESELGPQVKFQTEMEFTMNSFLSLFHTENRAPQENEVTITLLSPFCIEVRIPGKFAVIKVMFTFSPIDSNRHMLYIDVYSDRALYGHGLAYWLIWISSWLTYHEDYDLFQQLNTKKLGPFPGNQDYAILNRYYQDYGEILNSVKNGFKVHIENEELIYQ